MDVTLNHKLEQIKKNEMKPHVIRRFIADIRTQISNYRYLAHTKRGTVVGRFSSKEANILEEKLHMALGIKNEKSNQSS